jgi:hypothetical protein
MAKVLSGLNHVNMVFFSEIKKAEDPVLVSGASA